MPKSLKEKSICNLITCTILMSQHVISIRDHCIYAYHREAILLAYGKHIYPMNGM